MTSSKISVALRALRLFNEKADELEESLFTKRILTERSGVEINAHQVESGMALRATRFGPDKESIKAFVLTFRFFVQDNEPSSFRNMAGFYNDPDLPFNPWTRRRFNSARDAVNADLDAHSFAQVNNQRLTNREIFEVFLWGGLAHAYAKKGRKETYDMWKAVPGFFQLMENDFVYTLARILNAIFYIRELSKEAISELEAARQLSSS